MVQSPGRFFFKINYSRLPNYCGFPAFALWAVLMSLFGVRANIWAFH